MKMKVERAISNCGGEISNVLSPEISLIISDKVSNEKNNYPFNGCRAAGTRGYKMLQKASELNPSANAESTEIVARKYGIAISTCEKFLASIKDGLSIDKRYNSDGVQEGSQKETKLENLTKTAKGISGLKLCKLAVCRTNAIRRFFNRNTKKLQASSSPEIEHKLLEKNFIKVEDCSRQKRPLYKSNVFRKLVFCRCSYNVFHSVHTKETKLTKTSSCYPQASARVGDLNRTKYFKLSGHCEICDLSFHCMWTHITGEMHKENVCQSSYSKIYDLLSQLPSVDEFLNKYCADTNFTGANNGDICLQSFDRKPVNQEHGIECSNIEPVASIVTSSSVSFRSSNNNEIDFNTTSSKEYNSEEYSHGKTKLRQKTPETRGTKTVPLYKQLLARLLPDEQVKLPTYNCHIFKCSFSEFLFEQMRKHLQLVNRTIRQYYTDQLSLNGSRFYKNACIVLEDPMKANILRIVEPYYKVFANLFLSLKGLNSNPARKSETIHDFEIKCFNTANVKPHNLYSLEMQNSQEKTQKEDLKLNINDNVYVNNNLISKFTYNVWSEIIRLLSIDSSIVNYTCLGYTYEIKHTESEKAEQNKIVDSTEVEKMVKVLSFLTTRLFNFNYTSTHKTVSDDVSCCKQSLRIEQILDACKDWQSDKETSVIHNRKNWLNKGKMTKPKERRATKVKNEITMNWLELKMNDEKVRLKGNKDVVLPECTEEIKKAGIDNSKMKAKKSMAQADDSLAKYSYSNTLNTPQEQLKGPNVYRKKLSLKDNFYKNATHISADSFNQLEFQKRESSNLTGSQSKWRERKKPKASTSIEENTSTFSVSSFSRKTDTCTDGMYSSMLAQSSSLRSYRRLDKLVIKKTKISAVREISLPSICIESRKCYSLNTSEKCACEFNLTMRRKACPTCRKVADLRIGNAASDLNQREGTGRKRISLDKQFNESFSDAAGKVVSNISIQSPKAFVSPQKSVQKTIRNVTDTCSENWTIKFNRGLRMTLCRI